MFSLAPQVLSLFLKIQRFSLFSLHSIPTTENPKYNQRNALLISL